MENVGRALDMNEQWLLSLNDRDERCDITVGQHHVALPVCRDRAPTPLVPRLSQRLQQESVGRRTTAAAEAATQLAQLDILECAWSRQRFLAHAEADDGPLTAEDRLRGSRCHNGSCDARGTSNLDGLVPRIDSPGHIDRG